MMLTELAGRVEISSLMPLTICSRRLPPDLLSRIDNVIAVTGSTPPGGAYDTAGCLPFDRRSLKPLPGATSMSMISGKA